MYLIKGLCEVWKKSESELIQIFLSLILKKVSVYEEFYAYKQLLLFYQSMKLP